MNNWTGEHSDNNCSSKSSYIDEVIDLMFDYPCNSTLERKSESSDKTPDQEQEYAEKHNAESAETTFEKDKPRCRVNLSRFLKDASKPTEKQREVVSNAEIPVQNNASKTNESQIGASKDLEIPTNLSFGDIGRYFYN